MVGVLLIAVIIAVIWISISSSKAKREFVLVNIMMNQKINDFVAQNNKYSRGGLHHYRERPSHILFTKYSDGNYVISTLDDNSKSPAHWLNHLEYMRQGVKSGAILKYEYYQIKYSGDFFLYDPLK